MLIPNYLMFDIRRSMLPKALLTGGRNDLNELVIFQGVPPAVTVKAREAISAPSRYRETR